MVMIPWNALGQREQAFRMICEALPEGCMIVETGTVRIEGGWGSDGCSTLVWDWVAGEHGGHVITIDRDPAAGALARRLCSGRVEVITGDSVQVLKSLAGMGKVDLLYLDSYDIEWAVPEPSARHHLDELCAARGLLGPGSIVAVDDNRDDGVGKGMRIAAVMHTWGAPEWVKGYVRAWRMP